MAYDTGNKYIDTFLDLMQWLKDVEADDDAQLEDWLNRSPSLDYKQKQIGYSEKQKIIEMFETIIDQPAFMSNDHKRFRKLIIDWYSTHRATITHTRQSLDPHSMTSEALNEMIRCFGFPYPHKIVSSNLKAQFILDIIELYKKKGTPWVLVQALQTYFGLNSVVLSEWWIHHNGANDTFYAKAHPIIPRSYRTDPRLAQELSYDVFIRNKPLWRLTENKLRELYDECVITLPSMTTYISMNGTLNILEINIALSILNRKIQESYEFWLDTGTLNENVYLSKLTSICSLLSLVLGITYLFNSQHASTDTRYQFYNGFFTPLDVEDDDGNRDDIDDVDYNLILDEYDAINIRPTTKAQKEELLETRYEKFSEVASTQSVTTALGDAGTYLEQIQPDFKQELDDLVSDGMSTESILESLLSDLDFYMINSMEIIDFPISYLVIGAPIEEHLKDVINFFKPYHTQLRDFTSILSFDDPLGDSQLEYDEFGTQVIKQWHVEEGNWAGEEFDQGLIKDEVDTCIEQELLYFYDSSADENVYTRFEYDDELYIDITQLLTDEYAPEEEIETEISQSFIEHATYFGLDYGYCKDDVGSVDLVTYPNGITDGFEVTITVDGIETSYNSLPEVIIWKTL
jgi:hypothetical protein